MKKFSLALLVGFGLVCGSAAQAAVLDTANGITTTDCNVLSDTVKPSLSKNVVLAYTCNKDQNLVKVASCHQFGSRKIETITCASTGTDETTGDPIWNDDSCASTTDTFQTGSFGKAYRGSSSGGSVAAADMSAACDAAGSALSSHVQ
ncbi:MAG: hypothetical protein NDI93_08960 [Pseudomonas sp.]|nr:hypothetical protein [Pseudomonas sp.]